MKIIGRAPVVMQIVIGVDSKEKLENPDVRNVFVVKKSYP
tara:strand:- start:565 stop:684 length:120 start_codon:yes stop_codon:yes gene_type:complete